MGIMLVMIVRQEAAVIRRCLEAAKPLIDGWSIVDTGSTDETRDVIQEVLKGVPGKLHDRPWVNFGHNRSESLRLAKETAESLGNQLCETWLLLLDADHEIQGSLNTAQLSAEGYMIQQWDTALAYSNTRLIRADLPWKCVGVTHEYWAGGNIAPALDGVKIVDHADGGTRHEKFERDLKLLLQGVKDEPQNVRYWFYLAQTYEGMGQTNNAIKWYAKRAEAGGYADEAWMARLRMAKLLSQNCQIISAQTEFLRCYNERPDRAEPLYWLARQLRDVGCHSAAFMYAKQAAALPLPSADSLFVDHWIYRYGAKDEMAISGYYCGKHAEAFEASEHVLATKGSNHASTLIAQSFYVPTIEAKARGTYPLPTDGFRTWDGVLYNAANPSTLGDVTNVRFVNYVQERGKHYAGRPEAHVIKSKNAIVANDGDDIYLLDDRLLLGWNQETRIHGLEDVRLARWNDQLWFTATCCQVPGKDGKPQVVLGRIDWDVHPKVGHLVPIAYDRARDVEKNWLLWSDGRHGLKLIYSFDPFVVLSVNPETGEATEAVRTETRWWAGRFRGSANPIPFDWDKWIAVVHDVAYGSDRNVYTHRFVTFDRAGNVTYSKPFFLEHNGIEYCAGLSYERGEYTLSYGYEDREAKWLKVDSHSVREMLGDATPLRRAA